MLITGQKANLRELRLSDEERLFKLIFNNKNVLEYFMAPYIENYVTYMPSFNKLLELSKLKQYIMFTISQKENDQFIGLIIEQYRYDRTIELGYCIGEEYWNQGIMTDALLSAICYISQNLPYDEVICSYMDGNEASKKVLEKCGFEYQKTVKGEVLWNDIQHDVIYYSFKIR